MVNSPREIAIGAADVSILAYWSTPICPNCRGTGKLLEQQFAFPAAAAAKVMGIKGVARRHVFLWRAQMPRNDPCPSCFGTGITNPERQEHDGQQARPLRNIIGPVHLGLDNPLAGLANHNDLLRVGLRAGNG